MSVSLEGFAIFFALRSTGVVSGNSRLEGLHCSFREVPELFLVFQYSKLQTTF